MRINWGKVPYYMITIKPPFGNLGKVIQTRKSDSGVTVYHLRSLVNTFLIFEFYEHEVKPA